MHHNSVPLDIVQTVTYRNARTGQLVEHDVPHGQPFAVGEFYTNAVAGVRTPTGVGHVQVRVHFDGCVSLQDAFARFDAYMRDNLERAVRQEMTRQQEHARKMSLANTNGSPLQPDDHR